jgi:DNA-binding MarR family transcriptional regulator
VKRDEARPQEEHLPLPVLLASIGRNTIRLMNEALEPTGLKPRHIPTLMALSGGALTQSALAEATSADPTTLVGLLNDLELDSLVTRRRDPTDRRRHIVALSERGRQRLEAMTSATRHVESRIIAGLDHAQVTHLITTTSPPPDPRTNP